MENRMCGCTRESVVFSNEVDERSEGKGVHESLASIFEVVRIWSAGVSDDRLVNGERGDLFINREQLPVREQNETSELETKKKKVPAVPLAAERDGHCRNDVVLLIVSQFFFVFDNRFLVIEEFPAIFVLSFSSKNSNNHIRKKKRGKRTWSQGLSQPKSS